jgi:hypothetical protein
MDVNYAVADVNQTVIANSALASSFPLANTDRNNLYTSIRSFLTARGVSVTALANIDVYVCNTIAHTIQHQLEK